MRCIAGIQHKLTPVFLFLAHDTKKPIDWLRSPVTGLAEYNIHEQLCIGISATRYTCREHVRVPYLIGPTIPEMGLMEYELPEARVHMREFGSRFDGLDDSDRLDEAPPPCDILQHDG